MYFSDFSYHRWTLKTALYNQTIAGPSYEQTISGSIFPDSIKLKVKDETSTKAQIQFTYGSLKMYDQTDKPVGMVKGVNVTDYCDQNTNKWVKQDDGSQTKDLDCYVTGGSNK